MIEAASLTEDQVRSLEARLEEWLLEEGVEFVGGLEIVSIDLDPIYVKGKLHLQYRAFYSYENRKDELRRGDVYFTCRPTYSGTVEDVRFEEVK